MIWGIAAIVAIIWVGRKIRPAHLGDDILKFQLFRHLQFRNARDAAENMTYEDLERKLWLQISTLSVCAFVCMNLSLRAMGLSWTYCLVTSAVLTLISLTLFMKYTRTYRHITLPLFATLCRMPQSRWDMRSRPLNWVKVDLKKGKVWIRLPKDWHATKRHLEAIQELTAARLPGQWKMTANTRKFLLTLTRESEAETILLPNPQIPAQPQPIEDELDFTATEKELEDDPW